MASVRLHFLGTPGIEIDGQRTTHFRWSKLPAFFAYLVLHPGEHSRERIASALWPERSTDSARQNLRQILLYCDQLLAPATDAVLNVTRQSIGLRKSNTSSDIDAFIDDPWRTRERPDRAKSMQLVGAYAGPFLPALDDDWIVSARMQMSRSYQEALVFLANEFRLSDPNRSLSFAEVAVKEDPYDDPARAAKIAALIALGRNSAAQQEYSAFANFINAELGMQPGRIVSDALAENQVSESTVEQHPEPINAKTEAVNESVQALRRQQLYEEASALAVALVPFWIAQGTPAYGFDLLMSTLTDTKRPTNGNEKLALARLCTARGDTTAARKHCDEILSTPHPKDITAQAMLILARLDLREVNAVGAIRNALSSLRILRQTGNSRLQVEAWNCLAIARFHSGQFERALRPAISAERISEQVPDVATRQELRIFRAFALLRLGRKSEAEQVANAMWSEWNAVPTTSGYAFKSNLGRLLEDLGRRTEAKSMYLEALAECRNRGNRFSMNVATTYLGDIELELGDPDESLKYHFEALKSRRELYQNLGIATNLRGIGRALLMKGLANEARTCLLESAQRFRDDNAASGHASSQLLLAEAEFIAGDRQLASRLAQNSVEILRGMTYENRLTIGPWGATILERGEKLLQLIQDSSR